LKPLRKRVLRQLERGENWLEKARKDYEKDQPREGEKKLELALGELRLAQEKSRFWGHQEKKPPRREAPRRLPLVAGLVCSFLLLALLIAFSLPDSNIPSHVAQELEVDRQLSLPSHYGSGSEPRILDDKEDLFSSPGENPERDIEGLISPVDL